ncbi:MAG: M28 family peptidase [Ginsengibacter sp.]
MKKLIAFIACYLAGVSLFAQIDEAQKYGNTITSDNLKKHLAIIASAGMEGRETGTAGQRNAASYIEEQFKLLGLKSPPPLNGYQQTFSFYKDTLIKTSLKIGKNNYEFGKDFILDPSVSENQEVKSKKIIFVGYGISDVNYDDYKGKNVKGKIVVFFTDEPKAGNKYLVSGTEESSVWSFPGIPEKAALAKQKGAAAAFVINLSMDNIPKEFVETARRSNVYFPEPGTDPVNKLNYATILRSVVRDIFGDTLFNNMINKANEGEPLNNVRAEVKSKIKFEYKKQKIAFYSTNVIGYIEGTDKKDEYVFLTAHYDHLGKHGDKIYYGADDDGSGTCAVISMAQAFAKAKAAGNGPKRTVVFMTVSGEEKGLWGSEYYSENPVFPLEKTSIDLNTDMVGRIDTERKTGDSLNYIYVIGHNKLSTDLPVINEGANKKYTQLELDYKYDDPKDNERIYYRSDHYNFARKGVPILFFYDGMLKADYHKPTDTIDKIVWDLYEKRVRMIFYTAWEIANRNNMLRRDIPLPLPER